MYISLRFSNFTHYFSLIIMPKLGLKSIKLLPSLNLILAVKRKNVFRITWLIFSYLDPNPGK